MGDINDKDRGCPVMEDYFYPTDVEGKVVWLARRRDKEEWAPILFCPWCGRALVGNGSRSP